MLSLVLLGKDLHPFAGFVSVLKRVDGVLITQLNSGKELIGTLENKKVDVVVVAEQLMDGTGLQFVRVLVKKQPLVNCALVSNLSPEKFHEETEGLGIFMQLPEKPTAQDAEKMMLLLESINVLMGH